MIISASRRTDIPAFYGDWFINRVNSGFVSVRNPFNYNQVFKIILDPDFIDCLVFWTKNPDSFIYKLKYISSYKFYFLFTVTPYNKVLEKNLPDKKNIIKTFKKLSDAIGNERLIWRYDPVLLNNEISIDFHLKNFEIMSKEFSSYTNKCIISFIRMYNKCRKNLKGTFIRELTENEIYRISERLSMISAKYNIRLQACAVKTDLKKYGIDQSSCIDKFLIEKISGNRLSVNKDKYQRKECNCYESIDIGVYNTCIHNCLYCYANSNIKEAIRNFKRHDSVSSFLIGNSTGKDIIFERMWK